MREWGVIVILVLLVGWSTFTIPVTEKGAEVVHNGANSFGTTVGEQAPPFTLQTLEGTEISLADFEGQPVMINFWATWCPPCRAEMPEMERFYVNHDIEILAVNLTSTESSQNDVQEFVENMDLSFPILLDETRDIASFYNIQPLPTSLFIDGEGVIRHVNVGPMNEEMMIRVLENIANE